MNQIKIGEFLKELRKEKGLTQEQLAEQFNVSRRSVSRWETGSNMPDLSMLITLAEYYEVEVKEIIDGKRKSENMNEEMKDTLEKVASYNEMLNLKSMRKGIIIMSIVFIIMVQISLWKEVPPTPLVSLICAYNGATYISKARESKDKSDFITGSMFLAAMLLNTIAFIVK
ncbi:MAG: helix-turn-helix transcriptional regulator [Lachnospiraceae bacterium]|nr:helix-turn-helix transcriptional regulator [Lachnospiraceae bacterium]